MSDEIIHKPQPQPNDISLDYWEGTREGKLKLQQCASCGTIRHYPRPVCDRCFSMEVRWVEASGRGRVHSWTVAHHPYHPAFRDEVPYVLLTVDLEEGVRAMGRLEGDDASTLALDLPVRLRMVPADNGYALPSFSLVKA